MQNEEDSRKTEETDLIRNFEPGDLVYGLKENRQPFLDELEKYLKRNQFEVKYMTTEDLNNIGNKHIWDYWDSQMTKSITKEREEYLKFLQRYDEYLHNKSFKEGREFSDVKFSRACKLLAVHSARRGYKIHFILDGVNHKRVTSKTYTTEDGEASIDHSVTGSELRAIYREWHIVKNFVIFYEKGKEVPAPWEDNNNRETKKFYKGYGTKRSEKKATWQSEKKVTSQESWLFRLFNPEPREVYEPPKPPSLSDTLKLTLLEEISQAIIDASPF